MGVLRICLDDHLEHFDRLSNLFLFFVIGGIFTHDTGRAGMSGLT